MCFTEIYLFIQRRLNFSQTPWILFKFLIIYFWLNRVFVAVYSLSLVAVSRCNAPAIVHRLPGYFFKFLIIYFWLNRVFIAVYSLSLVAVSRCYAPATVHRLPIREVSLVAEHGLKARRLSSWGWWVQEHKLMSCGTCIQLLLSM